MSPFTLAKDLFIYPTPVGTYYAVSSTQADKSRKFIKTLLAQSQTPKLNVDSLSALMDEANEDKVLELLYHGQKLGWLQAVSEPLSSPEGALEQIMPPLLQPLTESGKVLLADDQGFYLACSGFNHEVAEELSALSADIATVHNRRAGLLINNLNVSSQAWSLVDAFGNSQIGFWPLFIDQTRFVLVVSGLPHFNQAVFVELVWALSVRYTRK